MTGRAFRVEFRAEADVSRGICAGRVEHLRSGDAAHFASVEELLAFVAFWLGRVEHAGPAGKRRRGT